MDERRILIVEDDPEVRGLISDLVGTRGWDATAAGTPAEALDSLDPPPDCLVLDLTLPDGGGEALLRRVREAGLTTRVVAVTPRSDAACREWARGLGADALLVAPWTAEQLYRACEG